MMYSLEYFNQRVRSDIEAWPVSMLASYARLIELLAEFGPNLGMPNSRAIGNGLFELRIHGREGIGRVMYCFLIGKRIVILHSFVKKTRSTPRHELEIARKRKMKVNHG